MHVFFTAKTPPFSDRPADARRLNQDGLFSVNLMTNPGLSQMSLSWRAGYSPVLITPKWIIYGYIIYG